MADRSISELPLSEQMTDDAATVVYQSGETRKIAGASLKAYARKSVEDSAKEAAGLATEGAEAAQAAAEAARTGAESAKTSAEAAETGAAAAQTAAESAKRAAEAARAGAETANTDAQTAKTAAIAAQGKAEAAQAGAETAKTAAETAQAGAESARDGAFTAKTASEAAKDRAVTAETNAAASQTAAAASAAVAQEKAAASASSATAAGSAQTVAESARDAAQSAKTTAESAKKTAVEAQGGAEAARDIAVAAQTGAESARDAAKKSETAAKASETAAEGSAGTAQTQAGIATAKAGESAASAAAAKASETNSKASETAANASADAAEQARQAIEALGVQGVTLPAGSQVAVGKLVDADGTVTLKFSIPQGAKGDKGDKGDRGVSITAIERTTGTGAAGTTDTYTITLSDGGTSTFTVYNGRDGDGSGDMLVNVYDPAGKASQVATAAEVAAHAGNGDVHVTAAQKAAWNAKQNALTFDTTPTAGSDNPVTSGGVRAAIDGIPTPDVSGQIGAHNTAADAHSTRFGAKLDKTGDGSNVTAAFTAAGTRANIATGEKLSVLFGKIAKWLADLKTVAFSGSYSDLTGKPTLGSLAAKSMVAKADLATDVQTSLGKADTALQSYTETDPTVPSWAKAASKPSYTKSEVGLGNVDNTSDANKPISTAVQTALNGKAASSHTHGAGNITSGTLAADRLPTVPVSKGGTGATAAAAARTNLGAAARMQWTNINVPTTAWAQNSTDKYYYATVSVSGMLETDNPHSVDIVRSADAAADALCDEAFGAVDRIETLAGSIKLRAPDGKPTVAFKLWMEATR